ncbi:MAG: hypothetical protein IT361_12235 [Gemmatimonadaceae bacterium]|nr:hypothetical protein [Gemmatimonadaceae bacterium]
MSPQATAAPAPSAPTAQAPATAPVAGTRSAALERAVLEGRRNELSRQLNSVESRRSEILRELGRSSDGAVRQGLEGRLKILDERLVSLEREIEVNGRALSANPRPERVTGFPGVGGTGDAGGGRSRDRLGPLMGIASLLVLTPLVFAMARRLWRGSPAPVVHRDAASDARLERIEQAVDAIAIEVERISEAQRFQNKLLGEGQGVGAFGRVMPREAERVGG